MLVLEQCESTGNTEGDCKEVSDRMLCHLLAGLSDIDASDFDFGDVGVNDQDWDNDWEDWEDSSTGGGSVIAKCGHINFSNLEFVYQCFYD